jgi:putative resolvase
MKNKRLLPPSEAAAELGISIRTLYRWEAAEKLQTVRTVGKQRRIPIEEFSRLRRLGKGLAGAERCVLYARVSSVRQEQDGNLARQTERLLRFGLPYLEEEKHGGVPAHDQVVP